jgi:cytochrome c-type biogenesis protein CcmF
MIVHLGVVLLAVGLAASEAYKSERTVSLDVGETATVEGHEFRYLEPGADINDRRLRVFAAIEIDGDKVNHPAVTNFRRTGETVPTPSVRSGFTRDIFLVLATSPDPDDDSIDLRVVIRPMVAWIWIGGVLMAVGTALALFPGRRRRGTEPTSWGLDATPDPVPPIGDTTPMPADGHPGGDGAGGSPAADQTAGDEVDRTGAGV